MFENSKVMIRIEYERNGMRRVLYGEIDESKIEAFHTGEGNFICFLNDGKMTWIDKEAILSINKLETKSCVYEKDGMEDASFVNKQNLRIVSYEIP